MAINPAVFRLINVTDTCAVWNVLSSRRLFLAAVEAGCDFCVTSFVQYECLIKRRSKALDTDAELMERLRAAQTSGRFKLVSCGIDDLQSVALLERRKRLGKGELSSIAFASKIRQAVLTDDMQARRLADSLGTSPAQTTPHLFAWLLFTNRLGDSDKLVVIREHESFKQILGRHLEEAYRLAMECRLNAGTNSSV